jgi:N6-adenosine-specific RNA methylase IME4
MLYRTILADPPWNVKRLESPGAKGFGTQSEILHSIALPYSTMTVTEIAALQVPAERDAHCYIWTINKYVRDTYAIMEAWDFEPSTLLTWAKAPMGLGLGGTFCNSAEFVLFGRRGSLRATSRIDRTWWQWKRGKHSAKPEAFQDIVEQVSPGPYLELFARRPRLGWTTLGNELSGRSIQEDMAELVTQVELLDLSGLCKP